MTSLVWLPFDPSHLGDVPDTLRYEVVTGLDPLPATVAEVEFFVPPLTRGVTAEVIDAMTSLQVLQTTSAGVDVVRDLVPEAVTLCNAKGVHNTATAEHAVTLTLAAQRAITEFADHQAAGSWAPRHTPGLGEKTVLIVGYGSIGKSIAARLDGFEAEVVKVARSARPGVHGWEELPDLLPAADVVILIVPLTDQTRGLVDADFLGRMKTGALLVNVARGPVVDTDALLAACESGRIRAAIDVTDPEPLPPGHPLWAAPNLLLTPHVGGDTDAEAGRLRWLIVEQLNRFAAGEPLLNVITGAY